MTSQDPWNELSSCGYGQYSQWDMPRSLSSLVGKIKQKEIIQTKNKFEKLRNIDEDDEDEDENMMK